MRKPDNKGTIIATVIVITIALIIIGCVTALIIVARKNDVSTISQLKTCWDCVKQFFKHPINTIRGAK